jgi:ribosomal protein L37E
MSKNKSFGRIPKQREKICSDCGKSTKKLFKGKCKKCSGGDEFLKYFYMDKRKNK